MSVPRKKILILADYFLPGFKAGGPIQSIQNLCLILKSNYKCAIITRDTDLGSRIPYDEIKSDTWNDNKFLGCRIYYCSKEKLKFSNLKSLIQHQDYDYLYLNSLYSPAFTIPVLRMLYRNQINGTVILAPRGELNPGARKIKQLKKSLYINLLKITRLPVKIVWHATSKKEKESIKQTFGKKIVIKEMSNIPNQFQPNWQPIEKKSGEVKLVTISRISKIKNLEFIIQILNQVIGKVQLDIYGPCEDSTYWNQCEKLIRILPQNISVNYRREVINNEIPSILRKYHFFISPSKGENFGHSIFEAMLNGKPVLISDRTPWVHIELNEAGWAIPLKDTKDWIEKLHLAVGMNNLEYELRSKSTWNYAKQIKDSSPVSEKLIPIFN